jgi:uncharacterized phage protein gp47/JayE
VPIIVPTRAEIEKQMQSTGTSLDPTLVVSSASDFGIRVKKLSEALYGIHVQVGTLQDDLFVSGATSTEALEKHAEARLGSSPRKGATTASGAAALDITGDAGATVAIGEQLTSSDGNIYETTTSAVLDANGDGNVSVVSTTKGEAANRDVGETLTFTSAPSGVDAEGTVVVAITGGEDQETDGELMKRVLDAYANPPAAGRFSDWRQWAVAVEGVISAYSYGPSSSAQTGRRGLGIVDVAILKRGSGANRIPATTVQDAVVDYIEDRRPATTKEWAAMLPTTTAQDIDIELTPKTGYEWDWTDDSVSTTQVGAAGWNSTTLELELDSTVAAMSADIAVGDRMLVAGQLAKVLALPPATSDTDMVKLQPLDDDEEDLSDFATAPVATDTVYAAGPLTAPALRAIKAYMDSLGPARGTAADPEQDWEDTVRVNKIDAILIDRGEEDGVQIGIAGVKDTKINTPASNQVPTDAAHPGVPELFIYGVVTPRPVD